MKFSEEHKTVMRVAFSNYNRLVELEQDDYLEENLFVVMSETDLKSFDRGESDFRDFAIEAYIRNIRKLCDGWEEVLNAVRETRNIADYGLLDEDE